MVQNRGDIGLDKVVMKGEREEKKRTVCLKKPNLIRPLPYSNNNPPPEIKREIGGEKKEGWGVTDWVSVSEPFLSSYSTTA